MAIAATARRTSEDGKHSLVYRLNLARLHDVACEQGYDEQHYQYGERP